MQSRHIASMLALLCDIYDVNHVTNSPVFQLNLAMYLALNVKLYKIHRELYKKLDF